MRWIYNLVVTEKLNNIFGYLLFITVAILFALIISSTSLQLNVMIVAILAGIPVFIFALKNNKFGLYFLITFSSFMPLVNRLSPSYIPFGLLIDLILVFICIMCLSEISKAKGEAPILKDFYNPITILIFIWVIYNMIQIVNPGGSLGGWFYGIRSIFRMLLLYFVLWNVLDNVQSIKQFTRFYIVIGTIVALYGIYQDYVGFPSYDFNWVSADALSISLYYVGGKWRKFSTLTDPAAFGMFMALMVIFTGMLAAGSQSPKKRVVYLLVSLLSIFGMFAAGIRTAYVVILVGIILYVLLNITNTRTLIFAGLSVLMFLVIFFGPFHSNSINWFRSAFKPSEDASYQLRDINRKRVQPYIYSHPLGGGLSTTGGDGLTYIPWHPLAGFPTDSAYLKTLLELGWIGLILELGLYMTIMIIGVNNYYKARSPEIKMLYLAYLIGFFGMSVAYYAKQKVDQFPVNFFLGAVAVLMTKLIHFDEPSSDEEFRQYS